MLLMKVEMFGTQKSAMPLSFSNFHFLPIYKADSAGSRTYYPFGPLCFCVWENVKTMDFSEAIVVYDIKVGRCSQTK